MDVSFILYSGVAVVLAILTFTDMAYRIVDDRVIIAGTIYVLICKFYLGEIIYSLTGAGIGFIISLCIFLFGNRYFSIVPKGQTDADSPKINTYLTLPLVPALTACTLIHALLPDGLANFLLEILFFIQSHTLTLIIVLLVSVALLFLTMKRRKVYMTDDLDQFDEQDKKITAFGDGDITTSIFLGSVLGWQNFIAVFWLAMVILSIIGVVIFYLKKKGKCQWI